MKMCGKILIKIAKKALYLLDSPKRDLNFFKTNIIFEFARFGEIDSQV